MSETRVIQRVYWGKEFGMPELPEPNRRLTLLDPRPVRTRNPRKPCQTILARNASIRERWLAGESVEALAEEFKLGFDYVRRIARDQVGPRR